MSEPDFDITQWGNPLPFEDDARGGVPTVAGVLGESSFAYIGQGMTLPQFAQYVAAYDFGTVKPDYIVLHHTAIPTMEQWTAGEAGKTGAQVYSERLRRLNGIKTFYAAKGWTAGPHLFIDDRYIWLFTPMAQIGIHAAQGNSYKAAGKLHYSIGIEVVGNYERQYWPAPVARLVAGAVAVLKMRLKNFGYEDKPWAGGVGAHRMYNKPSCPGACIQPSYYLPLFRKAYDLLTAPPAETRHYIAKANANIRRGATTRQAPVTILTKGMPWSGVLVEGDSVTLRDFGTSKQWVCNGTLCVWKPLLEEAK